jgi:hypothetical protein
MRSTQRLTAQAPPIADLCQPAPRLANDVQALAELAVAAAGELFATERVRRSVCGQ